MILGLQDSVQPAQSLPNWPLARSKTSNCLAVKQPGWMGVWMWLSPPGDSGYSQRGFGSVVLRWQSLLTRTNTVSQVHIISIRKALHW